MLYFFVLWLPLKSAFTHAGGFYSCVQHQMLFAQHQLTSNSRMPPTLRQGREHVMCASVAFASLASLSTTWQKPMFPCKAETGLVCSLFSALTASPCRDNGHYLGCCRAIVVWTDARIWDARGYVERRDTGKGNRWSVLLAELLMSWINSRGNWIKCY